MIWARNLAKSRPSPKLLLGAATNTGSSSSNFCFVQNNKAERIINDFFLHLVSATLSRLYLKFTSNKSKATKHESLLGALDKRYIFKHL